jgi:hypothetical protein
MDIGMLWFDNDPKTDLTTKLTKASSYYLKKYGQAPNLCFVHPSMVDQVSINPKGLEIRQNPVIRPNHFWLGRQT